jgi:hypothetical protein
MDLLALIFMPPIGMFVILAVLPAGRVAAIGFAVAATLIGATAAVTFPLGPAQGPDDWYHGIEILPFSGMCAAWVLTGLAQLWRWARLRTGQRPHYLLVLLGMTALVVVLFISTWGSF